MLKTVSSITNAIGALNYKGTWNASTNTPTIVSSTGTKGDYYVVSVAGTTTIDGISNWGVGDWIAFNGAAWQRVEGGADLNGVNLSVSGTSTLSGLTASTALALNASKEVVSVTNTGTGNNVLADGPTLTTPALGAATATSVNKVTITAPATGSTLTIADGKTLTANNSIALTGTDATTMTFPTTNATIARTDAGQTFAAGQIFTDTIGVGGATPAASGAGVTFPATQSASTDPNTLDDYEEGTYTPTVSGLTFGNAVISGGAFTYVKVGRICTVSGLFSWGSTSTSTGDWQFSVPFPIKDSGSGSALALDSGTAVYALSVVASTTNFSGIRIGDGTGAGYLGGTSPFTWAAGDVFAIGFTYPTT